MERPGTGTIRPARAGEAEVLSDLALRSKAYWGYDQRFLSACREELTLTPQYLTTKPSFVLERSGGVLGFYTLEPLTKHRVELGFLFVEHGEIGQGLGRLLLEHAIAESIARGFSTMVIQSDPHAVGFYERLSAVLEGTRPSASIPGRRLPLLRIDLAQKPSTGSSGR